MRGHAIPGPGRSRPATLERAGFSAGGRSTLHRRDHRRRDDGQDRGALQAPRADLPGLRDLRRNRQYLRLRALRRPAQEQRHGRLVEGDDPGARRHRGARLGDHPAPADLGGVGSPGRLQRPPGAVPGQVQAALPRGPPARGRRGARRGPGQARLPRMRGRTFRAPPFQPHVRDHDRPRPGGRLHRLPAPGDRPGHLPRLQDHAHVRAQEAAVRNRPDRQVVPQRDHARELHLPHARVRADGDGVLRAAGRGREVARLLDGAAAGVVRLARREPRQAAAAPARRRGAVALQLGDERHRVPLPDRLVRARGDRQPRRLRPQAARRVLGAEARLRRHGHRRALRAVRDRAGRRPRAARS